MGVVLLELLLFAIVGGALGLLCMKLTERLIEVRVAPGMNVFNVSNRVSPFLWAFCMAALFCLICLAVPSYISKIEYALVICAVACIAVVDISIKRIPNELLLTILAVKVVSVIAHCIINGFHWTMIVSPFIGMAIGLAAFLIPSLFHLYIGNGDIKYGAVVGFYFGFYGFLQSMIVMGLVILVYYLVLRITKKGGLKTHVPMGPFFSLGVLVTMFLPVIGGVVPAL